MSSKEQEVALQPEDWKSGDQDMDGSDEYEPSEPQTVPPSTGGEDELKDDNEDDDDYDPDSITVPEVVPEPGVVKFKSQTKTSGGFILDASDDEHDENEDETENAADNDVNDLHESQNPAPEKLPVKTTEDDANQLSANQDTSDGPAGVPVATIEDYEPANVDPPHDQDHQPRHIDLETTQPQPDLSGIPNAPPVSVQSIVTLEARVKDDPHGDLDAWLALIAQYRLTNKIDELRDAYDRFLKVFPQCAAAYVERIEFELSLNNFAEAERLFGISLLTIMDVDLWTVYLNYIRRRNDLTNDPTGTARTVVAQAYEYVMDKIGLDKNSGKLWTDYITFIRSAPGQIGGTSWQDQQKVDQLRKAYQRAIAVPTAVVNTMWKEYDQFEMGLNKMNGRKFIQEHSPSYMTAKSATIALESLLRNLQRTSYPRLQPCSGFDGYDEFMEQVDLWNKWIEWEKSDPLVLEEDDNETLKKRILHCYQQALMALRFYPPMWVDCATWCFENNIVHASNDSMGMFILSQGRLANPESVLLALKHADRIESSPLSGDEDPNKAKLAAAVREPYNDVLDTLYAMCTSLKDKENAEISRIEELEAAKEATGDMTIDCGLPHEPTKEEKIQFIKDSYAARTHTLNRTISFVWIALIRAMRRLQGKGGTTTGGLRQAFTDARVRGRLTSDVYVTVALLEAVVYKDPVGGKIFERGAKLFPDDEVFMLEYLKYLYSKDDTTNARVVFETCVNRLTQKPENMAKAKVLYQYFHNYESQYGELSQIIKLEKRMKELFPEDPELTHFRNRFITDRADKFDALTTQIVISPSVQQRPKIQQSVEMPMSVADTPPPAFRMEPSPGPQYAHATNSPKRPYPSDDTEDNRPRKFARGESPLKGAAGRRLDQQRRAQGNTLHRDITFLLTLLPPGASYDGPKVKNADLINILRNTNVPDFHTWKITQNNQETAPVVRPPAPPANPTVHRYSSSQNGFVYNGDRGRSPFDGNAGRRGPPTGPSYRQQTDEPYRYQY